LRSAQGLPPITPLGLGSCINLDNVRKDSLGRTTYLPGAFRDTLDQKNVSWRIGIDYDLAPTTLLYLNVAKSYKAGGYPNGSDATDVQMLPVVQESLLDYEGGFKTELFDRSAFLSGAVFYYDYKDKQLEAKDLDPIFGLLDAVRNIPKSRMIGAELSINWTPIHGFNLYASGTYLDSKILEFNGYSSNKTVVSFAGDPMPFAPKVSLTAGGEYSRPLTSRVEWFAGMDELHNSKTYANVGTDAYATLKPYDVVNARLGIRSEDKRWQVNLWGRNIFNEYYYTNGIIENDVRVRYAGLPATFGVAFAYKN
jgi:outer membrane receptor protein involved in Fe transport